MKLEFLHKACPMCGDFRLFLENEDRAMCANRCCPVYGISMPIALKTDKEVLTYAGWIPEKYRIGRSDGYRYFNPKLYRCRVMQNNRHYTLAITRV